MTEREVLSQLSALNKEKGAWPSRVSDVADALEHPSGKVKAKALWLLGEMGLLHPEKIEPHIAGIAGYLTSDDPLLRERALNALGRIGRAEHRLIAPYLPLMRTLATDEQPPVRLAFIWACENIATNTPELFETDMERFASLLNDENDRVRIEAPEIFRVLGRRKPGYVAPYLPRLQALAEHDPEPVVRIHASGAIKATARGESEAIVLCRK